MSQRHDRKAKKYDSAAIKLCAAPYYCAGANFHLDLIAQFYTLAASESYQKRLSRSGKSTSGRRHRSGMGKLYRLMGFG
jgi:hypothetical protein